MTGIFGQCLRVAVAAAAMGMVAAVAADPEIPAWVDINAQIAAPTKSTATATWTLLDTIEFVSAFSQGFNYSTMATGSIVLFR